MTNSTPPKKPEAAQAFAAATSGLQKASAKAVIAPVQPTATAREHAGKIRELSNRLIMLLETAAPVEQIDATSKNLMQECLGVQTMTLRMRSRGGA